MKTKKINNRTIIGIVCIVLALVVTFGVSPLVNRILKEGVIYCPIVLWKGKIVDGYYRYLILKDNPHLKYRVVELDLLNRFEAISWLCYHLLGKRS